MTENAQRTFMKVIGVNWIFRGTCRNAQGKKELIFLSWKFFYRYDQKQIKGFFPYFPLMALLSVALHFWNFITTLNFLIRFILICLVSSAVCFIMFKILFSSIKLKIFYVLIFRKKKKRKKRKVSQEYEVPREVPGKLI